MKRLLSLSGVVAALAVVALLLPGCGNSYPVIPDSKGVSTVTYPSAMGNYSRVYAMTYKIVNRYSVVKWASYSQGEIVGEMLPDNHLFDKTRKIIHARIFDEDHFFDVEVRVLVEVETSEVDSFGEFQPRFNWRPIAGDARLETKLNNEIKLALTDNAGYQKHHVSLEPEVEDHAPLPPPELEEPERRRPERRTSQRRVPKEGSHQGIEPTPEGAPAGLQKQQEPVLKVREGEGLVRHEVTGEASYADLEALGVYYMRSGRYALARTSLQTATEIKAKNPFGWYLLGHAEFANGKFDAAADAIRKGLANNPHWSRSGVDFRSFYGENIGDFAVHFGRLESAVKANPTDANARFLLGYVYFFSNRYDDALTQFDSLLTGTPGDEMFDHYRRHCLVQIDKQGGLEEH